MAVKTRGNGNICGGGAAGKARKLLLVDGYNVLRSTGRYRDILAELPDHTGDAYNAAREALLNDVASFAGREYQAIVVFDGGGNPGSSGEPQRVGGLQVVFSKAGSSADSYIEDAAKSAAAAGREVLVVTSDAQTQWTVLGEHVTRMSAQGFVDEISMVKTEHDSDKAAHTSKMTLGERLDAQTLAKLNALRGL